VKPELRFFEDEGIVKIRDSAIALLAEIGVDVSHEGAKRLLQDAGAKIHAESKNVLIPGQLSDRCLSTLPREIVWGGRKPQDDLMVGSGHRTVYRTLSGAEEYMDLHSREYRKARISDVRDWAVLVDALPHLDAATIPYYAGSGVNLAVRDVQGLAILWEHTRKHTTTGTYGPKNVEYIAELMSVERGSAEEAYRRPRFTAHISPVPPLQYHGNSVEMIMQCGRYGIPVNIIPMPMRGVSAPITLSGTVLVALMEMLAGVVISQVANPGAPLIYAGRPTDFDLKRTIPLMGSIETAMIWAACAQVAKKGFGWIVDSEGPTTDSPLPDGQSLVEIAFTGILPTLSGSDVVTGAGGFETTRSIDPVLLVIADEFCGMLDRLQKGLTADEEYLGVDAVRRVGAGSGKNYLTDPHTLKYMRTEAYEPKLCIRIPTEEWIKTSGKPLEERAREKAISILKHHEPDPLDDRVVAEMRRIVAAAEKEITGMTTE
jgi:trimethylamine--corrinoid protein Co-methyltransferase